jgi:hypothetical protein
MEHSGTVGTLMGSTASFMGFMISFMGFMISPWDPGGLHEVQDCLVGQNTGLLDLDSKNIFC